MKLNLQLFAEGEGEGIGDISQGTEVQQPEVSDRDMFEQMYYEEPEVEAGGDDSSEMIEQPEDTTIDGANQQPWKNQHNAEMAAARRRQEQQMAVDQAYANMFRGQVNPYTGQPIQSERDYNQYLQQQQQEQLQQAGLDPNMIDQMIQNHPAVQQAQTVMHQQQRVAGQQRLVAGLQAISQFDPDVKTFEDILACPNFAQIDDMFRRGYSLEDAYKLANMDKIAQRKQAAAKQQAINQVTGKRHMQATGNNGAGNNVSVPADVMEMYRQMNPNATDAQIKQHYARTHKE